MVLSNVPPSKLVQMLKISVQKGIKVATKSVGNSSVSLKKSEAYRQFGRTTVDRWIKEGLVTTHLTGNGETRINKAEIRKVARSSNRITYLEVENRK